MPRLPLRVFAAALPILCLACTAHAGVSVVGQYALVFASGSDAPQEQFAPLDQPWNASVSSGLAAQGVAGASAITAWSAQQLSITIASSIMPPATGSLVSPPLAADVRVTIDFALAQDTEVEVWFHVTGDGLVDPGDIVRQQLESLTTNSIVQVGGRETRILPAGVYRIETQVAFDYVQNALPPARMGAQVATITIIPAPTSAGALALGGVLLARRRRGLAYGAERPAPRNLR